MIDEMRLGFSGHCPTTVLSDFYAAAFDLWHAGKRREAFDMFGRIQAFNSITGSAGYLMVVRGVFKEETKTRAMSLGGGGAAAGGRGGGRSGQGATGPLDEATKQAVRDAWEQFMKPYLRG
jgi:hypothetical protein